MMATEICEKCNIRGYGRCVCENQLPSVRSEPLLDSLNGRIRKLRLEMERLPDMRGREAYAARIGNRILGIIDAVEIIQAMESNAGLHRTSEAQHNEKG